MKKDEKKPASRETGSPGKSRKHRRVLRDIKAAVIAAALVIILGGAAVGVGGYLITKSETNLPNVYVGEVYVGKMTEEETLAALRELDWDKTVNGTMEVRLPMNVSFKVDRLNSGIELDAEKAAAAAYSYGHDESWLGNLLTYIGGIFRPTDVTQTDKLIDTDYLMRLIDMACVRFADKTKDNGPDVNLVNGTVTFLKGAGQMEIDRNVLCGQIVKGLTEEASEVEYTLSAEGLTPPDFQKLLDEMLAEPSDAYYDPETDSVMEEVVGINFDVNDAVNLWNAAGPAETVVIPVNVVLPKTTKAFLEEILFRDMLGQQVTRYWGSSSNRINNIELVAAKLNGLIMMPGDVFSYNGYVGERTTAAGFLPAAAYNDGQVVQEVGGGICQVSSTLYCAAMRAQLETVERTCHIFPVTYLDPGLDATVSWPGPDFKFRNSREYPVKLVAYCDNATKALTVEVWGSDLDGSYVELRYGVWPRYDTTHPEVEIGYGARSFRQIFDKDGNLIAEQEEAVSLYDFHAEDIQWPEEEEPIETDEETGEIIGDLPEPEPEQGSEPESEPGTIIAE